MTRRLLAFLGALVVALGLAVVMGSPAAAASCPLDGPATRGLGTAAPVLLVHGFGSSADTWATDLYPRGQELPGAPGTWIADPFDYSTQATEWIQGNRRSTAAKRLAERISCLSTVSRANGGPGEVALVGHSMGGLLIRCALDSSCSRGPDVTGLAGQVVTIGTPSLGSFLRPNAANATATALGRVVEAECAYARAAGGGLSGQLSPSLAISAWAGPALCDLITQFGSSSAARAFTVGSTQLQRLPAWPASVDVRTVGVTIDYVFEIIGWERSENVGDVVVGLESALWPNAPGDSVTIDCGELRPAIHPLVPPPPALPDCWHITEPKDARALQAVAEAIGPWAARTPPTADPCSSDAAFTTVTDWANPELNSDGYYDHYELVGCADGYVVGAGLPVTETDTGFIVYSQDPSGWSAFELYGVGLECGESGLPAAVDALLSCTPPAATGTGLVSFATPSGNITCYIDDDPRFAEARCDIAEPDFVAPPPPAPCAFGQWGNALVLDADGAHFTCVSDSAYSENQVPYGGSVERGPFRCDIAESGVTCRNTDTGAGFTVARAAYSFF